MLGGLLALCVLAGCRGGGPERELAVTVLEADTGQPIPKAVVIVSRSDPHHPLDFGAAILPDDAGSTTWRTDERGFARVRLIRGRAQTVEAWAIGFGAESTYSEGEADTLTLRLRPVK